jgi:hypothetical protein
MTERKTSGRLTIFRRLDAGNVPAPWVPPEVPASTAAPGRAVATRDRTNALPAPWVPAELPASTAAPAAKTDDRKIGKLTPWVPPAEAPRNLPAVVSDDEDRSLVEPQKRKKRRKKQRADKLTSETVHAGQTTINIVNQVAAPAPVYVSPYWGWWGGCPHVSCPLRAGRTCWRFFCWW